MIRYFLISLCSVSFLACDSISPKNNKREEKELIGPEEKKALEKHGGLYPEV